MGLLARANQEANSVARMKAGSRVALHETKSTNDLIDKLPHEMKEKLLKQAVRDAGKVVIKAAQGNLRKHQSSQTGTASQWSASVRRQRQGQKWNLLRSIGQKVKVYDSAVAAFIGARRPYGSHLHLLEFGGVFSRWGKSESYQPPRPVLRPAGRSTLPEQSNAMVSRVKREWKSV